MLNFFKQQWPLLVIYLALGQVLYFANIYFTDWAFWAIWVCFLVQAFFVQKFESTRYLDMIRKINEQYWESHHDLLKRQLESLFPMPTSSDPAVPADTSPHDAKPPQS